MLTNLEQATGITKQGFVVRDFVTGRRWKVRTNMYTAAKALRGNHSRPEYSWFTNLQNGTLDQYYRVYPEEVPTATAVMAQWNKVVSEVYDWYVHVYKVRDIPKAQIPAQYKGILFELHGEYLKRLQPLKQSLCWKEHQSVMAQQDIKRKVFLSTFNPLANFVPRNKKAVPVPVPVI